MKSSFQFLNYKIDNLSITSKPTLEVLLKSSFDAALNIKLSIINPQYYVGLQIYLGGIKIDIGLPDENDSDTDFSITASIVGAFHVVAPLEESQEVKLVKNQIPAILFPYLRAAITTTLAASGFGSVIIPLLNFNAIAASSLKDVEIERIDE